MRHDYECRDVEGGEDDYREWPEYRFGLTVIFCHLAIASFLSFSSCVMTAFGSPAQDIIKYDAASVTISGSGCSGTLICPRTVLTAAHCQVTGQRVTVRLSNGSRVEGRVIAHRENEREGIDAAIIRLDSTVEGISPVPVAADYPPDKTEVLVYGRAKASGSKEITRFRCKVDLRGDGGWLDLIGDTAAIGGESGGGVFYDGKLIGIVSRSNSEWKRSIKYGNWTGASVTDRTYKIVADNPCGLFDCPT